jgi:hypothetical protein
MRVRVCSERGERDLCVRVLCILCSFSSDRVQDIERRMLQEYDATRFEKLELEARREQEMWALKAFKPTVNKACKVVYQRLRLSVEDERVFPEKYHRLDMRNFTLYGTLELGEAPTRSGFVEDEPLPMEQRSFGDLFASHLMSGLPVLWSTRSMSKQTFSP